MIYIVLILLFPLLFSFVRSVFFWSIPPGLVLFIGVPGSGKTTLCAYFSKIFNRSKMYRDKKIYCNVPITGTLQYNPSEDFGINDISNGVVLCDEGGIEFNNRKFRSLPDTTIKFAKLFRHYGISSFLFFSQGMDIDITFLRLSNKICLVYKSIIPFFVAVREVNKYIGIDDISHQLIDQYVYKRHHGFHLIFMPTCWHLFDSYECPSLPKKEFIEWSYKNRFILNDSDTPSSPSSP